MLGSHWFYLVIILMIALIVFGPGRLPEVGGGMGRAIREFRKATTETTDSLKAAVHEPQPPVQGSAQQPVYAPPQIQAPQPFSAPLQTEAQPAFEKPAPVVAAPPAPAPAVRGDEPQV